MLIQIKASIAKEANNKTVFDKRLDIAWES